MKPFIKWPGGKGRELKIILDNLPNSIENYYQTFVGDHIRLAEFCKKTKAKFMMVIKNTDFIFDLYKDFNIQDFNKNTMLVL